MSNQVKDQINALSRVKYLIEEESFLQLIETNDHFADVIGSIYDQLDKQVAELSQRQ